MLFAKPRFCLLQPRMLNNVPFLVFREVHRLTSSNLISYRYRRVELASYKRSTTETRREGQASDVALSLIAVNQWDDFRSITAKFTTMLIRVGIIVTCERTSQNFHVSSWVALVFCCFKYRIFTQITYFLLTLSCYF